MRQKEKCIIPCCATHELVVHADRGRETPDLALKSLLLHSGLLFAQEPAHKVVSMDYRAAHGGFFETGDDEREHDGRGVDDDAEHCPSTVESLGDYGVDVF